MLLCDIYSDSLEYNYTLSTESHYSTNKITYAGKYISFRKVLDYRYHRHYSISRQVLQDNIIDLLQSSTLPILKTPLSTLWIGKSSKI